MIEIRSNQVTSEVRSLFASDMPTAIRCFAVLAGGNAGRIFVDDLHRPTKSYVWEQDDGTLYQGGVRDRQMLQYLVGMLRQQGPVGLDFRDGESQVDLFPPDPEVGTECVELERPAHGSDLTPFLIVPEGFSVHRMGRELIENSPRLDETLFRYGDIDNYLKTGMDVCILHGDEYVGEAGADIEINGVREVGVVVEPAYRKAMGFGTLLVAHLLQWCDELGVATYWDCVKLNIGSLKIARKLGFGNERNYKILAWFPLDREVGFG
ncbi:MAG TPA: GNAT family N-acetyltransferase [Anaerolineales bacterium]|nr:GNAT family N-acetyltransferase [Anaerolineales bacterium]